jgi:hypothetical protein
MHGLSIADGYEATQWAGSKTLLRLVFRLSCNFHSARDARMRAAQRMQAPRAYNECCAHGDGLLQPIDAINDTSTRRMRSGA